MVRHVTTTSGNIGYRHQLDRARRFLDRVETQMEGFEDMSDVEFQDDMWSFFQHCWHVKDWLRNDPLASQRPAEVSEACRQAHASTTLMTCRDLCNGTKHLKLTQPGAGTGASHSHIDVTIAPEQGRFEMDCMVDDGHGNLISGKQLARDCIAEWERILASQGFTTARRS